jgi:hypothetical protein
MSGRDRDRPLSSSNDEGALPDSVSRGVDQAIASAAGGDPLTPEMEAQVRERAYQIYDERRRSGLPGDALSDWLAAECEVLERWRSPLEDLGPPAWSNSPRRGRRESER